MLITYCNILLFVFLTVQCPQKKKKSVWKISFGKWGRIPFLISEGRGGGHISDIIIIFVTVITVISPKCHHVFVHLQLMQ